MSAVLQGKKRSRKGAYFQQGRGREAPFFLQRSLRAIALSVNRYFCRRKECEGQTVHCVKL